MAPSTCAEERLAPLVLFMGSVGGGTATFPCYDPADLMSKAAVSYLTRHLAAAHPHTGLDVVCLAPGATDTPMFRASTLSRQADPAAFVARMPKGRLLRVDEVAETAVLLATRPALRILHGASIDASLGLGVRPGLQTDMA